MKNWAVLSDVQYFTFSYPSSIGYRQIISLRKIQMYCQDTQLIEPRQAELRSQCLELWQLPDRTRTAPQRSEAKVKFMELLNGENPGINSLKLYDSFIF